MEPKEKLVDKIKSNTKRLLDLSLKIAGIRGTLFVNDSPCDDGKMNEPVDVKTEIEYQSFLLSEIERDIDAIAGGLF